MLGGRGEEQAGLSPHHALRTKKLVLTGQMTTRSLLAPCYLVSEMRLGEKETKRMKMTIRVTTYREMAWRPAVTGIDHN